MEELTQEYLKEKFIYVNEGILIRIPASKFISDIDIKKALSKKIKNKYPRLFVHGKQYQIHRLIFLYHHGHMPKLIDHINGDSSDNRIENLRAATNSENTWNSKLYKNNKSGLKGIYYSKETGKWVASIYSGGKRVFHGRYVSKREAAVEIKSARIRLHGDFSNHGDGCVTITPQQKSTKKDQDFYFFNKPKVNRMIKDCNLDDDALLNRLIEFANKVAKLSQLNQSAEHYKEGYQDGARDERESRTQVTESMGQAAPE
jgi:hypothetical protein